MKTQKNDYARSPLHWAVSENCEDVVRLFLFQEEALVEKLQHSDNEDMEELLRDKVSINVTDNHMITPLMLAAQIGSERICLVLLEHNEIIKELKDDKEECTALLWAAKSQHERICKILLDAGCNQNEKAKTMSLLHCAAEMDNVKLLLLFLEYQDDPNTVNVEGETPLAYACKMGAIQVVKTLLLNNAKKDIALDKQSHSRKTPLHYAVERQDVELVRLLLSYGADPNLPDMYFKVPLFYAAELKNAACCALLKEKISYVVLNSMKRYLLPLIEDKPDLEELFGLTYDQVPHGTSGQASFEMDYLLSVDPQHTATSESISETTTGYSTESNSLLVDE